MIAVRKNLDEKINNINLCMQMMSSLLDVVIFEEDLVKNTENRVSFFFKAETNQNS